MLQVNNLSVRFKTKTGLVEAVTDTTFSLSAGEVLGIAGESGCGKTTAALSIMKLLPKNGFVEKGEILFEGEDMAKKSEEEMRGIRWKKISIIFQGAMNALNPVQNVEDQIAEPMLLHEKVEKHVAYERARKLLEEVGIDKRRGKEYPHEFSGGMRQRVMIAMALACDPSLVIADEPVTALDVMVQAQILELLKRLQREHRLSIILITHDLSVLAETCNNALIMYAGRVCEYGTTEDIFYHPTHPYTKRLISAFPNIEKEKVFVEGIAGDPPNLLSLPPGCPFAPRCSESRELCRKELPALYRLSGGHHVACHRW